MRLCSILLSLLWLTPALPSGAHAAGEDRDLKVDLAYLAAVQQKFSGPGGDRDKFRASNQTTLPPAAAASPADAMQLKQALFMMVVPDAERANSKDWKAIDVPNALEQYVGRRMDGVDAPGPSAGEMRTAYGQLSAQVSEMAGAVSTLKDYMPSNRAGSGMEVMRTALDLTARYGAVVARAENNDFASAQAPAAKNPITASTLIADMKSYVAGIEHVVQGASPQKNERPDTWQYFTIQRPAYVAVFAAFVSELELHAAILATGDRNAAGYAEARNMFDQFAPRGPSKTSQFNVISGLAMTLQPPEAARIFQRFDAATSKAELPDPSIRKGGLFATFDPDSGFEDRLLDPDLRGMRDAREEGESSGSGEHK